MFLIKITKDVQIEQNNNIFLFKGPLGKVSLKLPNNLSGLIEDDFFKLKSNIYKKNIINTYKTLIKTQLKGVTQGFKSQLFLKGIGYKCFIEQEKLIFKLGFSHSIEIIIPNDIQVNIMNKNTQIIARSVDKLKLTQFISLIRQLKKPESYKGKGILYKNEIIILKEGKKNKK